MATPKPPPRRGDRRRSHLLDVGRVSTAVRRDIEAPVSGDTPEPAAEPPAAGMILPATIPGVFRTSKRDRLVLVEDPDLGIVPVRWQLGHTRNRRWRCHACGPQITAECRHTYAAAMRLAEHLLGLTPVEPIPEATSIHLDTDTTQEPT